jgi:hypothetical protein
MSSDVAPQRQRAARSQACRNAADVDDVLPLLGGGASDAVRFGEERGEVAAVGARLAEAVDGVARGVDNPADDAEDDCDGSENQPDAEEERERVGGTDGSCAFIAKVQGAGWACRLPNGYQCSHNAGQCEHPQREKKIPRTNHAKA